MSKYKKLFSNTLIFTISEFASKFLVFFMLPIYTSYMTSSDFGTSDLINTTVNLLIPIFTLSISSAVMRFSLDKKNDIGQTFFIGLKVILLGILTLMLLYPLFSNFEAIDNYILLFYLMYIAQALDSFLDHFARGLSKIKLVGIVGIVKTLIVVFTNILLLIWLRLGIEGYLISYISASFVSTVILAFGTKPWKYSTFKNSNKLLKSEMIRYSIPLMPNSLSWWLNNSVNKYIIFLFGGASQLGMFAVASRLPTVLTTIQNVFGQALVLSVIDEYGKKQSENYYTKLYQGYNFVMVISCSLIMSLIIIFAKFLFAKEFYGAWEYVPFLLISTVFGAMSGFLGTFYSASKKNSGMFITTLIGGIVAVISNLILVPLIGVMGASISTAISYILIWVLRLINTRKYVKLKINFVKDSFVYILIILQAVLLIEMDGSGYLLYSLQLIIILLILLTFHSELLFLLKTIIKIVKEKNINFKS